jgi:hypothetical protein
MTEVRFAESLTHANLQPEEAVKVKPYLVNHEKDWVGSATAQSILAGVKLGASGNTIGG